MIRKHARRLSQRASRSARPAGLARLTSALAFALFAAPALLAMPGAGVA